MSCLSDDRPDGTDIFKEVKKLRKVPQVIASVIDGNSSNIENHFSDIYKPLYNSVDDEKDVSSLFQSIDESLSEASLVHVRKVTAFKVKEAADHLNAGKTDPVFDFSSDSLKNGPTLLYEHLSLILQALLIHSHVSQFLLLAVLVPIVKDKLGNISSSKNYRSIAISSLVLKIFDWLVVLLFGETFGLDDLQFSYQAGCSASMCTWLAIETIGHFTRNGGEVFTCQTDKTKAFDLVKHSILFKKLLDQNMPKIFLRLLMVMYMNQFAQVRWNGLLSESFNLKNGCKQGAVLSGILYNFYVNGLFQKLGDRKSGCWVGLQYVGMVGYADDDWLLAPSLSALQDMLDTCEQYNKEHGLIFSTDAVPSKSKTKCIAFTKRERHLRPMYLCGDILPWVKSGKHVGQYINDKVDGMQHDILVKRAKFIERNNTLRQEFSFAHPLTLLQLNQIYNSDFTGSCVWDLFSNAQEKLENSYNKAVRLMLGLPLNTHRYFLEPLSQKKHIKSDLIKRFLNFLEHIRRSKKTTLKYLLEVVSNDVRSVTGRNLYNIKLHLGKNRYDSVSPQESFVPYRKVPVEETWRLPISSELLNCVHGSLMVDGFQEQELKEILAWICTSGPS